MQAAGTVAVNRTFVTAVMADGAAGPDVEDEMINEEAECPVPKTDTQRLMMIAMAEEDYQ